jgi:hypothetical protein
MSVRAAGDKGKMGPSKEFLTLLRRLRKAKDEADKAAIALFMKPFKYPVLRKSLIHRKVPEPSPSGKVGG